MSLLSNHSIPAGFVGTKGPTGASGATGASPADTADWPSGVILMWNGTIAGIPSGWKLCDGNNGTPDLRSKFVKGAAAGSEAGGTGGSTTHDHDDHAARSHSGFAVNDHSALSHSGYTAGPGHGAQIRNTTGTTATLFYGPSHSDTQPSDHAARTHTISAQPSDHASQSHSTDNHEPTYYKLVFIMKE